MLLNQIYEYNSVGLILLDSSLCGMRHYPKSLFYTPEDFFWIIRPGIVGNYTKHIYYIVQILSKKI